jgi:integrase
LAKYSVAAVTAPLLARWRDDRLKAVSGGTVARDMILLSHVFTVAIREWGMGLPCNPMSMVRKPPQGPARDRVLSESERESLLDACRQCRNPWIYPVVFFALETAGRRGEILALTWEGVNLERRTAKLAVTKAGQPRTIPLSPACLSMLRNLPRSLDGRVFPVTPIALRQAYDKAVTRAGIDDLILQPLCGHPPSLSSPSRFKVTG